MALTALQMFLLNARKRLPGEANFGNITGGSGFFPGGGPINAVPRDQGYSTIDPITNPNAPATAPMTNGPVWGTPGMDNTVSIGEAATENNRFNPGSDALTSIGDTDTSGAFSTFAGLGRPPTADEYNLAGNDLGLSSGQMQYQHGQSLLDTEAGQAALRALSASANGMPTMDQFNTAGNAFGITRNAMRGLWTDYNEQQAAPLRPLAPPPMSLYQNLAGGNEGRPQPGPGPTPTDFASLTTDELNQIAMASPFSWRGLVPGWGLDTLANTLESQSAQAQLHGIATDPDAAMWT